MPDRSLPTRPSLEQYKKQAKELLADASARLPDAIARFHGNHPRAGEFAGSQSRGVTLADAQLVLAREHGYESWPKFSRQIETLRLIRDLEELADPVNTFIEVASVDRGWHASGGLEHAEMVLARYPDVAAANVYTAAILGDEAGVRAYVGRDRALASAKGGPYEWDALTYLCFSRYLRIDKARSDGFVMAARVLLEAGASANTGWTESLYDPAHPEYESAIYGAAGIAQNAALTKLLLEFGADPNDGETPYHVAETYDNAVLQVLLESGRLDERSLATIAARKCDWHDDKGLRLALDRGANPNYMTVWKYTPLQQSIRRDNGLVMQEMMLDRGADPYLANGMDGRNAFQMTAYHGRGDLLVELTQRGLAAEFEGLDLLVAACARGELDAARSIVAREPQMLAGFLAMGGTLIARFAGAANDAGVRCLLALAVPASAVWLEGDGYWQLARNSTALHVAAWRAQHEVVRTLIAAGTPVNARDARGRTALQLAVKACTDSYWSYRRQPDSVAALLAAGAETDGIALPTGYAAIDELLMG
jgi:ankyrin repeat protein